MTNQVVVNRIYTAMEGYTFLGHPIHGVSLEEVTHVNRAFEQMGNVELYMPLPLAGEDGYSMDVIVASLVANKAVAVMDVDTTSVTNEWLEVDLDTENEEGNQETIVLKYQLAEHWEALEFISDGDNDGFIEFMNENKAE